MELQRRLFDVAAAAWGDCPARGESHRAPAARVPAVCEYRVLSEAQDMLTRHGDI